MGETETGGRTRPPLQGRPVISLSPVLSLPCSLEDWPLPHLGLSSLDLKSQPRWEERAFPGWGGVRWETEGLGGGREGTHQGSHTGDPHGQGVALLQHPDCGLEGVLRDGVGQRPNPAHEARLGLRRLLGPWASWSIAWAGVWGSR